MKKSILSLTGALMLSFTTACPGPDNVTACKNAVEAANDQECITDELALDADEQCPESLNEVTVDQSEYYDCVYGQYTCNGDDGAYLFEDGECVTPTE